MIPNLPIYISVFFVLTTFVTIYLFLNVINKSNLKKASLFLIGSFIWLAVQAILALTNVYSTNTNAIPPKIIVFGVLPTVLSMIYVFNSKKGKEFIDGLSQKNLTLINVVRIPVEIVLYILFVYKTIPEIMTFEGRNLDILAGISAPIVVYFGYIKKNISRKGLLLWHFLALGLLINIVIYASLSGPSPFQQFGFEQPNIAILYFPFCWLPTFIVPIVLFGHLVAIRQLTRK
jgi:hypothetical protein